ncbi:MAG: bifunctional phosphopantothenoylcysteine decarboxylase/phosphopantothenate--cysteine ligase CoaBC [Bacteroidales bacterium]|nr:bifunctional phosphopantothenoylcysteine decarboxylase/phosphopantothenate--cysteine ligase CoaBC [Bacteroidales bacterium]
MKKTILIGVSGGIACYKAIEVVNQLKKEGYNVEVIMTRAAQEFIAPLTFKTMSHNPVITDMFDPVREWDTKHIDLAKAADVFVIVPATANIIGKIANGIADDMLTTTVMAARSPVLIFPAMNTFMYENTILQENIEKLKKHGYHVYGTAKGELACGDIGTGKLLDWQEIVKEIKTFL